MTFTTCNENIPTFTNRSQLENLLNGEENLFILFTNVNCKMCQNYKTELSTIADELKNSASGKTRLFNYNQINLRYFHFICHF